MKIYKKTYGVRNLVEWQAIIPAGKGRLIVHFTGGSFTAYGVTPATYSTENPAHQAIIETSKHFSTGRIFLVKSVLVKEIPDANQANVPVPASPSPVKQEAASVPVQPATDESEKTPAPENEIQEGEDGFKTIEVNCFEDARVFLIENYGYTPSAVRTKELAHDKATANKIRFIIDGAKL